MGVGPHSRTSSLRDQSFGLSSFPGPNRPRGGPRTCLRAPPVTVSLMKRSSREYHSAPEHILRS